MVCLLSQCLERWLTNTSIMQEKKSKFRVSFSLAIIFSSSWLAGLLFVTLNMMQRQWKRSERKKGNLNFN